MQRSWKTALCASALAGVWSMHADGQTTWDLAAEWSNTNNPNGVWAYDQGSTALPEVGNFSFGGSIVFPSTQPAWAPSNTGGHFLPVWLNAQSTISGYDWKAGADT